MEPITFDQLPQAVSELHDKLNNIERLIIEKNAQPGTPADELLTIEEAASFAHLSKPTFYGLVSRAEVPCMKKGKRLYFSKLELTEWIKSGRKKTNAEREVEAGTFLSNRKRKRG